MNTIMKTFAMGIIIAFGCLNTLSAQESSEKQTVIGYGLAFVYSETPEVAGTTGIPQLVRTINTKALARLADVEFADMDVPTPALCQNEKGDLVVYIETEMGKLATPFFNKDGETDLVMPKGFWIAIAISVPQKDS